MFLVSSFFFFVFSYTSAFLYFFSFNENFLLIFFFVFFLYIINSKLLGFLFEATDASSLEAFLALRKASRNALSGLSLIRSNLEAYARIDESVYSSFESFLDLQLRFFLFLGSYSGLFYNQLLYASALGLIDSQNSFYKGHFSDVVRLEKSLIEFESE